mmetsp:Transcript_59742/g.142145  ORF Transcript_59742/g.142145 Transcript_59742/m.142145 type:complete len:205 (-) Transcript_59742:18-632(-)
MVCRQFIRHRVNEGAPTILAETNTSAQGLKLLNRPYQIFFSKPRSTLMGCPRWLQHLQRFPSVEEPAVHGPRLHAHCEQLHSQPVVEITSAKQLIPEAFSTGQRIHTSSHAHLKESLAKVSVLVDSVPVLLGKVCEHCSQGFHLHFGISQACSLQLFANISHVFAFLLLMQQARNTRFPAHSSAARGVHSRHNSTIYMVAYISC